MPSIFNIPADLPFSDTLAGWVLKKYNASPTELSRILLLLPSRRACIAMRDAFLRASGGTPLLLPRMQPIGDVDENMLLTSLEPQPDNIPPVDFESRRLFILARLIQQRNDLRIDYAVKLAAELARLLDELEREQIAIEQLIDIVPESFAEHWQITVDFLRILSEHWPQITQEEGIISPMSYRNRMLAELAKKWRMKPPNHPVIVAGTTGSIPSTAELIAVAEKLPQGMIVLPGLDTQAGKDYFQYLDETHAQWGMNRLLHRMRYDAGEIQDLVPSVPSARIKMLSEIMRPAELLENWQKLELEPSKAIVGMKSIICSNTQEEATVIALILREALETSGKTAALITHDRTLARHVCAIIKRFGITIDDSAGIPLMQTPAASFLRLIAEAAADNMNPVTLLSLLKHPLAHAGLGRVECLEAAREYEISVLRAHKKTPSANTTRLFANIEKSFTPFVNHTPRLTLISKAHIQCAEELAGGTLWNGPEAEAITEFVSELQSASIKLDMPLTLDSYREIFETLLAGKILRLPYGMHPRLKILSPIEARMQHFDRIILGGLNENSWPRSPAADPWLNRPMRAEIGLPSPERNTGLAAHDFFTLACAPEVFLTRAEKIDGSPTTASRWLVKLDTLLAKFSATELLHDERWRQIAAKLDKADKVSPVEAPRPAPPLSARPRTLSVTQVETWLRNPYVTYAQHILNLYPLRPIMREIDSSDFGNAVHRAIEKFVKEYPVTLPVDAYEKLLKHGQKALETLLRNERVKMLWWPRFTRIARFIIECEQVRRNRIKQVLAEIDASRKLEDFTITGRADRIEELKDGGITIIDYKTGSLPKQGNIKRGLSSQLALLAFIMEKSLERGTASLEYWQLHGGEEGGEIRQVDTAHIKDAEERLKNTIEKYNDPARAYVWRSMPDFIQLYEEYEHLARVKEWED